MNESRYNFRLMAHESTCDCVDCNDLRSQQTSVLVTSSANTLSVSLHVSMCPVNSGSSHSDTPRVCKCGKTLQGYFELQTGMCTDCELDYDGDDREALAAEDHMTMNSADPTA